jgi:hypothetical protein
MTYSVAESKLLVEETILRRVQIAMCCEFRKELNVDNKLRINK